VIEAVTDKTILDRIREAEAEYQSEVLNRYTAINDAETFSTHKIEEIRAAVTNMPPPDVAGVHSLAAAGSLARKEASGASDLDLIVVLKGEREGLTAPDAEKLLEWRRELSRTVSLESHNPRGVFAKPVGLQKVLSSAGSEAEAYSDVAVRILLLLESDWVLNEAEHNALVEDIVKQYAADIIADPRKNLVFLLNDVIRYFRTICVNYQYNKSETEDGKWPIRNIKLRHSRVLMYFSMVSAIGLLSKERGENKVKALRSLIMLPPLRRLFACYRVAGDTSFYKVAGLYDVFLGLLANPDTREALKGLEYQERYDSRVFSQLKATSDSFCSELLRFYEARRAEWDDRFFEYMIV
jgi:predicted nucleotidyltransferase